MEASDYSYHNTTDCVKQGQGSIHRGSIGLRYQAVSGGAAEMRCWGSVVMSFRSVLIARSRGRAQDLQ